MLVGEGLGEVVLTAADAMQARDAPLGADYRGDEGVLIA